MRKIKFSAKKMVFGIIAVVSVALYFILSLVIQNIVAGLDDQQIARRWSEKKDVTQVSCFFSENAGVTEELLVGFEHSMDNIMEEASITNTSQNPNARLFIDAYSTEAKLNISSEKGSMEVDAYGVGGDFFQFHPLLLRSGSYFSGSDLMKDYCIIDEVVAWQLFGSNNVVGMTVYINNKPHMIAGVVRRPEGRMEEAAGLTNSFIFISYESMKALNERCYIRNYEICMPNPVSGFAKQIVAENVGNDEQEIEIVENTIRFNTSNNIKRIMEFGTRSMNGRSIIYPYWENVARGYEDIVSLITFFMVLFGAYPIIYIIVMFVSYWKHKNWTFKSIYLNIIDRIDVYNAKKRQKQMEVNFSLGKDEEE